MPDINMQPEAAPEASYRSRSGAINELAGALAKAQGEMHGAKKDSVNPHFKSNYADLGSVLDAIRDPFAKNGLAVTQWLRTVQNGVEVETILMHSSGQFMSDILSIPTGKFDAHGIGSAATYCRRYALMAAVGIAPVGDDGNDAVQTAAPGSAGAGGQFRPERRSAPAGGGQGSALSTAAREIESGAANGTASRKPGAAAPAAKPTAAEKAEKWTNTAIQTLNLSVQTAESLTKWWRENDGEPDAKGVLSPIGWLRENAAPQYERLTVAFEEAKEAAGARVAA